MPSILWAHSILPADAPMGRLLPSWKQMEDWGMVQQAELRFCP